MIAAGWLDALDSTLPKGLSISDGVSASNRPVIASSKGVGVGEGVCGIE